MLNEDFLGGVVEGFYGQPWTQVQRLTLFDQMVDWGLNTYFYAPKDDLKHRAIWRQSYDESELAALAQLIEACQQRGINFIYGLSPGLDIRFADPAELESIKERFGQLIDVGARHFALLFDDLPGEMFAEDQTVYDSVAAAQSAVTNTIFDWLRHQGRDDRLLFCPTPYCDRMDRWQLGGPQYLETIGSMLATDIDILWTGPEIVSAAIPIESVRKLSQRIGRPPVIWDNLHANDYDLRRLYCGPYQGRSAELRQQVRGILANPNNEFPINYVPLRTLGQYLDNPQQYRPREAYVSVVSDWLDCYQTVGDQITFDNLILLTDCYYLPHEEGPEAAKLGQLVNRLVQHPVSSWSDAHQQFSARLQRVRSLFDSLTQLKDRDLFYAWSRRAWELKEELEVIQGILKRKLAGDDDATGIPSETHLPGTYRGGIVAQLQRELLMDQSGRFRSPNRSTEDTTGS